MNLFQAMRARRKTSAVDSDYLPDVNAFVDVAAGGKTEHLPIELIAGGTFDVRRPCKAVLGESALFNYSNGRGRFRFRAPCITLGPTVATYALPTQITVIEQFGNKRRDIRLKIALPIRWRYAPDGVGYGEFNSGTTVDMSCSGLALAVPCDFKLGTLIEVQFDILGNTNALTLVGSLARPTQKQLKGKFIAGLFFTSIGPTQENAIADFIQARHRSQRERALAN